MGAMFYGMKNYCTFFDFGIPLFSKPNVKVISVNLCFGGVKGIHLVIITEKSLIFFSFMMFGSGLLVVEIAIVCFGFTK